MFIVKNTHPFESIRRLVHSIGYNQSKHSKKATRSKEWIAFIAI